MSYNKINIIIELIMVMIVLIIFVITIYSIIYSGSQLQQTIIKDKNDQTDARITLSYINIKLRQNDNKNNIIIKKHPQTGENAIYIKIPSSDIWLFYYDNVIYEFIGESGEFPDINSSNIIMQKENLEFTIEYDEKNLTLKNIIKYNYKETSKNLSSVIYLRSGIKLE